MAPGAVVNDYKKFIKILFSSPLHLAHFSGLRYRMDFQLQPQITDRSYWSVIKSHFAYWTNPDVAAFIVNCLYRRDENDANKS